MASIKKLVEMVKKTTSRNFQDTLLNFIIDVTEGEDNPLEFFGCLLECKLRESILKTFRHELNETVYCSTDYQAGVQSLEFYLPGFIFEKVNFLDLKDEYMKDLKPFLNFTRGKRKYLFHFNMIFEPVKNCLVISIKTKRTK